MKKIKLDVYSLSGRKANKKVELDTSVFGLEPNEHSIYLAVNSEMAAMRQGTHSSKTKGEVRGTGAKPWRQKGTGRARIGYLRNPSRVHGSKAFGPKPHSYEKKVNRKVKALARKSVLSKKYFNKNLMVVEDFSFKSMKTKEAVSVLSNLDLLGKKVTILVGEIGDNLFYSMRNIKGVCIVSALTASTYDLLDNNILLADLVGIKSLNDKLVVGG